MDRESNFEVRALKKHSDVVQKEHEEAQENAAVPLSELDLDAMQSWLETKKPILKTFETDLRDAKRRIALAKGPKPKTNVPEEGQGDGNSGDESSVASDGE